MILISLLLFFIPFLILALTGNLPIEPENGRGEWITLVFSALLPFVSFKFGALRRTEDIAFPSKILFLTSLVDSIFFSFLALTILIDMIAALSWNPTTADFKDALATGCIYELPPLILTIISFYLTREFYQVYRSTNEVEGENDEDN